MKKDNYNIKFNQAPPNSDAIKAHQDFDGLLDSYHKGDGQSSASKPKRKIGKVIRRIAYATAAAIGLLILSISFKGKKNQNLASNAPYVNPPMEEVVPEELLTASVDANQGGRIVFRSGTVAVVPPRAFANRAGEVIGGEVKVVIKEYHDYVDFFLSGIPMDYDSLGTTYQLESAGMIEIYAEQDGERLYMIPEKSIDVELKSSVMVKPGSTEPKFNIYKLNENKKNWEYVTQDKMEFIDEESMISEGEGLDTEESISSARAAKVKAINNATSLQLAAFEESLPSLIAPTKPQKANTDNPTFDLKVDKLIVQNNISNVEKSIQKEEAALRAFRDQYAKAIWEVMPGQATWSPAIATTSWDDYDISTDGNGAFTVTFIKGESEVDVNVKPVLVGKDYNQAMNKFNQEFNQFNNLVTERKRKIENKKAELDKVKSALLISADKSFDDKIANLKANGLDHEASNEMIKREVLNRFSVSSFGIWNCDRPLPPFVHSLKGDFIDQHSEEYDGLTAFIVDKNRNSVSKFTANTGVNIQYNSKSDNLMWFVTKENKIAVFRPEEFKKINHRLGRHTFVMDLVEKNVSSENDIREILSFD